MDEATQQDRAFVAGASQALANWTEKYQLAMSQGVSSQGKKRPLDADDEIVEVDHDKVTGPPKKKKKKKNKSKDRSKDETTMPEAQDDGAHGNRPAAKSEAVAEEPAPVPASSKTLEEGNKVPKKKKKKKSAELEKF